MALKTVAAAQISASRPHLVLAAACRYSGKELFQISNIHVSRRSH
jgi:hypothetical protein